ncbi:hypothetical protein ACJ3XI_10140 [Litorimonas sp. RW-G-Af-16]
MSSWIFFGIGLRVSFKRRSGFGSTSGVPRMSARRTAISSSRPPSNDPPQCSLYSFKIASRSSCVSLSL